MDSEEDFNRYRYKTRVQVVAIIDILVGTIPFIQLAFAFNDKTLADVWQDREYLVLAWMAILCVYVLQLIMGIWLLAATRECYSEYTVGNCQVWYYIAMFTFVFYIGEMGYAIHVILKTPMKNQSVMKVVQIMIFHAVKIIYRAITLMTVNNFLYDICRPVYKYLSQGSFMYTSYYNYRLGIPPPRRRRRLSSVTTQMIPLIRDLPRSTSASQTQSRALVTTTTAPSAVIALPPIRPPPPIATYQMMAPPPLQPPPTPNVAMFSPPPLMAPPPTPAMLVQGAGGGLHYVPTFPAPSTAVTGALPVYNSTKIPYQPTPNYNIYFTYPQPAPKPYRTPHHHHQYYDAPQNNNHPHYKYHRANSAIEVKQPP